MVLLLLLVAQWGLENPEGKYFCPKPGFHYQRAESLHTYDVRHYELHMNLPMTCRKFNGHNKITCRSTIDGLTTAVLHNTSEIDSVKVDGVSASYTTGNDTMVVNLPQTYNTGEAFTMEIGYHDSMSVSSYQDGFVYYPKNYTGNVEHSIAYTLSQPYDARAWMPCYDQNYDKADSGCIISITVPDTFVVCANGELLTKRTNPDRSATYIWQEQYPISTYLMHFAASRYAQWSNWYYSASADTVECRYFVWPEDSAQSVSAYQYVPVAMGLYDSLYGSYPFDRYGHDEVYNGSGFGMEHQENTTLTTGSVSGSTQWENIIAHELAHMWWGDMVTCVDNRNIWLNEGFAMFSDANYNWYKWGHANFISTMQSRANSYFQADASNRRPLYDPPPGQEFNYGYTYCKANWVVHMLRYLDQEHFFPALSVYRDSFEYGCASTDDLNNAASLVYGTDLTWFFDEWVYDKGYPEYDIYWSCGPSGRDYLVWINIVQTQTNAPAVFHMPVEILLNTTGDDTLVTIPITTSPQYVEYTVSDSVTSIEFDPDYWVLKKYDIYYGIEEFTPGNPGYNAINLLSNPARSPLIEYVINQTCDVEIDIYDTSGRLVRTIGCGRKAPGKYTVAVSNLPAGIYFCRLTTPLNHATKKLVVIQ
jgi:aminopeptidase N